MQLYYDLGYNSLVVGPSNNQPVDSFAFKLGDDVTISIQFCQNLAIVDLPDPASTGIFGVKTSGDYDATTFLVYAGTWTKTGSGATAVYTFTPSFNSVELNAAMEGPGGPLASITAMGEIQWKTAAGKIQSSGTFDVVVTNDVIKGDEGAPTPATPGYPPAASVLSSALAGIVSLANGVDFYDVPLAAHSLSAAPSGFILTHILGAATDPLISMGYVGSLSNATNLALQLAGDPADNNQKVLYTIIPAGAVIH